LLLDSIHGCLGEVIRLEDCRSLEVMLLLPVGVLHALRSVSLVGGEEHAMHSL
jgi:hypothetical protein